MPRLGFGTYMLRPGRETYEATTFALKIGYRHIDTAAYYQNEADVGRAVRDSGLEREEVFVTTKLQNADQGFESALKAFDRSQRTLGLGVVDLFLLHWPVPVLRKDSWRALEKLLDEGRCRAIGVSNFMLPHLRELETNAKILPMVQQIEISPFLQQREVVNLCKEKAMVIEAYCPLTRGKRLKDPELNMIARNLNRTPAQVLLRWSLQKGYVPLPKSKHQQRIEENAAVFDFELSDDIMAEIDSWDCGSRMSWDPTNVI